MINGSTIKANLFNPEKGNTKGQSQRVPIAVLEFRASEYSEILKRERETGSDLAKIISELAAQDMFPFGPTYPIGIGVGHNGNSRVYTAAPVSGVYYGVPMGSGKTVGQAIENLCAKMMYYYVNNSLPI